MTSPAIREITQDDAAVVALLSQELGYPISPEVMKQRIESMNGSPDHAVYVACVSEDVVGWIHVRAAQQLVSEPRGEIGGLVVASEFRSRGIGGCLMARAEQWALERSLNTMVVRSGHTREAAHRFYLREGYTRTKISVVFTKELKISSRGV